MGFLDSFGKDAMKETQEKSNTSLNEPEGKRIDSPANQFLYLIGLIAMGLAVVWLFSGGRLSPESIGTVMGISLVSFMSFKKDITVYKRKEQAKAAKDSSKTTDAA
jgi:hypothetical protein